MGVSGAGKTTIGTLLAERLGVSYRDGDDLHPQANIDKMASGQPLNDEDRWPWLKEVGQWLAQAHDGGVIGCSALKRSYRDLIRQACPDVEFVHVHGDVDVLASRMDQREGHFMPSSLLESQLATLEPLGSDEAGAVFDIAAPADAVADKAAAWVASRA
ncbi:gluconokinase [Corynebacterium uberis]|uniref:gluconokinase n=1 Tax=Corynebacterium TaxID=1716 RepID=UPI001D0AD3BC|nr:MULTISPECIES: gluconokinase [Corynebacterium]MCZ9310232.1 gluconokinase [Corynebacterium sp. c6VSa_13]UDL74814.1 gluconokinase [Corynebacterium uberis]UDL76997.1 gluconokinase [Corynebacterium uberis]UDL79207.1 gluconokinase [Corynebacterium uberis]UDL81413.1 gluconokinase [Corynebacterium uberis]